MRKKYAIVVAAGKGVRMKKARPKQFLPLAGRPLLYYSIRAFLHAFSEVEVIVVFPPDKESSHEKEILDLFPKERIITVRGGVTRYDSVRKGLKMVKDPSVIFVHDGVRPLLPIALILSCYEQALQFGSAVPVIKLKDSIRQVQGRHNYAVSRDLFRSVQTPQTFLSEILLPAFEQPYREEFTDEATVVEYSGRQIHLVEGATENIKITLPVDLQVAEQLFRSRDKV